MILWAVAAFVPVEGKIVSLAFKTALLIVFAAIVVFKEPLLRGGALKVKKKLLGGK